LVGESGCGKSVTAFSILRLVPEPPGEYTRGEIFFRGEDPLKPEDLLKASEARIRTIRGDRIAMIFQDPMSSFNPILTIGEQITEGLLEHRKVSRQDARDLAVRMLEQVGISSPRARLDSYPHQLSGGMTQRAMIAMALICRPSLLIADEPTTAVDVTIQAQILDLLADLQSEMGMSILLITHDLAVVAETCDRVAVMYAGKIVESATAVELFARPAHPYTHGLFESIPSASEGTGWLPVIPGSVPNPLHLPSGCRFRDRCFMAKSQCLEEPPLRQISENHFSACHFAEDLPARHMVVPA
jgi:peptide/nickel transport system ATP-binding protein